VLRRIKAIQTLGLRQSGWYALYQVGLRTGHYRRSSPSRRESATLRLRLLFPPPDRARLEGLLDAPSRAALLEETEELLRGQARLFGGPPVPLVLAPPAPSAHWSEYELGRAAWGAEDVKFIWEPARFGWAYTLGRAYLLNGDQASPAAFWRRFEAFDAANPPNLGPNWTSGQEIALRLTAFLFAASAFGDSPESTPARLERLAQSVAEHAGRIPLTLPYARAQHNNHQVSEGLGLYAAGLALPEHPRAAAWREQGWRELNRALQTQIDADGTYCQHSTNYHRLMLQAALLADCLARNEGRAWPARTLRLLGAATNWLEQHMDGQSGRAANLGHNDGAHILPLAPGGTSDFRPTLQAASLAFRGGPALAPGPWDELSLWLGLPVGETDPASLSTPTDPGRLSSADGSGWASLRTARYTGRPAHADQLHVEIWQHGENIALDAGTYRYTAPAPWENALASTLVHNTLSVDGQDQMTRAGKFLWVDWSAGHIVSSGPDEITAVHDGYRAYGLLHQRTLRCMLTGWQITDRILSSRPSHEIFSTLHWLFPDWPYTLEGDGALRLDGPRLSFRVRLEPAKGHLQVIRAGEVLHGPHSSGEIFGWVSPAYGVKKPALAVRLTLTGIPLLEMRTSIEIL
jgi:hypothetical protein